MKTVFEARASTVIRNLVRPLAGTGAVYLLPANVCPIVPLTFLTARCAFEFVDIDSHSLCADWEQLLCRVSKSDEPKVAGILYVRTYGLEEDAAELFGLLKKTDPSLRVIDDRCAARPATDPGDIDFQQADVVVFSTGYGKYVDLGNGGFAHMNNGLTYERETTPFSQADLKAITERYKRHVATGKSMVHCQPKSGGPDTEARNLWGYSHWLDTSKPNLVWREYRKQVLRRRSEVDARKASLNALYAKLIPIAYQLPATFHTWRFQIRIPQKARLMRRIFNAGLFASDHYFPASTLFGGKALPRATALHAEIVNLFNDYYISDEQAAHVAEIVRDHVCSCGS